jgi:hypothetical protein
MEGKVKKAVGIALLVCVALTGLGLAAQPASAAINVEFGPIILEGSDDPETQTCYCADFGINWNFIVH